MSRAQPLSTLAPEYSSSSSSSQRRGTQYVNDTQCPRKTSSPCPKKNPCPPSPCPKKNPCPPSPCPKKNPCPPSPCPKKNPCLKTNLEPPRNPNAGYDMSYGWGWLGALILWFIIFTVLFWLIFYSLKPSFVLQSDSNQVDTAKVLLAAVIAALILVIVIWLIKAAVKRRYY
jgi:hypothetical protein